MKWKILNLELHFRMMTTILCIVGWSGADWGMVARPSWGQTGRPWGSGWWRSSGARRTGTSLRGKTSASRLSGISPGHLTQSTSSVRRWTERRKCRLSSNLLLNICWIWNIQIESNHFCEKPPRSNELLRHREGIVVEDTQFSCVIYWHRIDRIKSFGAVLKLSG